MTKNIVAFVVVAALVAAVGARTRAAERANDSLDAVKQELAAGKAVLLDVRERDEWVDGHLRDAKSLPLSQIENGLSAEQLGALAPRGKIIYLHCAAGARCKTAAKLLQHTGRDLRPLKQGYDDLLQAGFPQAGR